MRYLVLAVSLAVVLMGCGGGGGAPPVLPEVNIQATDASASETGTDPGTFTITRTGDTLPILPVSFTISGTATNGTDYNTINSPILISTGASSETITVTPIDDATVESTETVTLTINLSTSYTFGSNITATVSIADNDVIVDDIYEENDTIGTAWDFGSDGSGDNIWLSSFGGSLGVQADDDWYKIYVDLLAVGDLVIDCLFTHSEGDIDIALFDAIGTPLVISESITDNEMISVDVPNGAYYYILVYGENAANTYDLKWDD